MPIGMALQISKLFHLKLRINRYHQKRFFQLNMHQNRLAAGLRLQARPTGCAHQGLLIEL